MASYIELSMFLRASIERILSESGTKRKENVQLRKACEEALGQLKYNLLFSGILYLLDNVNYRIKI